VCGVWLVVADGEWSRATVVGMSDGSVVRLCSWCGGSFRPGTVGRAAVYCGRSCRQRAYEGRREARRIAAAVAAASVSTRDEPEGAAKAPAESAAARPAQGGGQSGGGPFGVAAGPAPGTGSVGVPRIAVGDRVAAAEPSLVPPQVLCEPPVPSRRRDRPRDPAAPPTKGKITAVPLPLWEEGPPEA
jgi:hypothetical protein